jgi:hypothetical protein
VETQNLAGGCLCGAVRYQITGTPVGSMICHCRTCRRLSAAPIMAWLTVPAQKFKYTTGTTRSFRSSPPVLRSFCEVCGTHLSYVHADDPDYVEVSTCSLDRPESVPPTHHSWLSHNVDWIRFDDGLPNFPGSRFGGAV